jgi:hypothetical protein
LAEENGMPLSVRIALGRPNSLKARSKPMTAVSVSVDDRASQVRRYRLAKSVIVSG